MKTTYAAFLSLLLLLGAPSAAMAQDGPTSSAAGSDHFDGWLAIGLKTGIYVPGLVNDMNVNANVALDVGLLLPFLERRLALTFEAGWAGPGNDQTDIMDPRIGDSGGAWKYDMTNHQGHLSFGPLFRILPPGSTLVPYVGVLGRVYMIRTKVTGSADGQDFGKNEETTEEFGFVGLAGLEYTIGPGALLLELSFGWSDLPHRITGDTSTGSLGVLVGYRLMAF